MNRNPYGFQSQLFSGIVRDVERAQPVVVKLIDPDDSVCREIKRVSPQTKVIVRIYTGQPEVDDAVQHPDAYEYGREYAERVYRAVKDPAHVDYIETENEPNDHYGDLTRFIQRLNDFTIGFCDRAKVLGFKPCVLNFSTGYPEVYQPGGFDLWANAWRGLKPCLDVAHSMGGVMGLHEYDAPDLLRLWSDTAQRGYLVGRHKAIYQALDDHQIGLYLGEFGIDWLVHGVTGGFWHNRGEDAPAWYMGQLRDAYRCVLSTTPQLRGICLYLHGGYHPLWEEYDTCRTDTARETFVNFMQEDLGWQAGATPEPPPTGEDMTFRVTTMLNAAWNSIGKGLNETGIAFNPDTAFYAKAKELKLGPPTGNEFRFDGIFVGLVYAGQCYRDAVLVCKVDDWGNAKAFDLLTGEPYQAAPPPVVTPPPGDIPAYKFPQVLTDIGAVGEQGVPIAGQPFYRLNGASVRRGISAFMVVTVFANGAPKIGVKVVNLFPPYDPAQPDIRNGEVVETDGSGNARFQFGASSAFTTPGTGPFTVFVADDSAYKDFDSVPKRVHWQYRLSDVVKSLGDFRGEHTEVYLQFVGYG